MCNKSYVHKKNKVRISICSFLGRLSFLCVFTKLVVHCLGNPCLDGLWSHHNRVFYFILIVSFEYIYIYI